MVRDNQYFFVHPRDVDQVRGLLMLRDEEAHHCRTVLRKKEGDGFFVVDGLGNEYGVSLERFGTAEAECRIDAHRERPNEWPFELTIAPALIKNDHFDLVVQKTTELGVTRILPVHSTRCVVDKGAAKERRWHKIAVEAMKQAGRSVLPEIGEAVSFKNLVEHASSYAGRVLFHERGETDWDRFYREVAPPERGSRWLAVVGPEGGFTDEETRLARDHGFHILRFGPRRLRAETAAILAVGLFSIGHSPQSP